MRAILVGLFCGVVFACFASVAWAIYRPVQMVPPKGEPWPHINEFTTGDGKHCVIAIFKAGKFGPPTLAMHCTWDRPKIEPAEFPI